MSCNEIEYCLRLYESMAKPCSALGAYAFVISLNRALDEDYLLKRLQLHPDSEVIDMIRHDQHQHKVFLSRCWVSSSGVPIDLINGVKVSLTNETINQKNSAWTMEKQNKAVRSLQELFPDVSNEILLQAYHRCVSAFQSKIGRQLEIEIKSFLESHGFPYREQVIVNSQGFIVGFNTAKNTKGLHRVDFLVGHGILAGKHIGDFIVISSKRSTRERHAQDDWIKEFQPRKYIFLTLTDDYPSSQSFEESERRLIITSKPRANDDRIYKLAYEDLLNVLM